VFGRTGTSVVCSLDISSVARFWYIRNETTEPSLAKAEKVQLSLGFLPAFSLAVVPNSLNGYLIGSGGKIFNCCRFGSATSPPSFVARAGVKSIAFSHHLPSIFAAASDDGRFGLYEVSDPEPMFEVTVNLSLGEIGLAWSPTRASVLFVSDLTGMRVFVYDFIVSARIPVFVHKVGSAAQSIAMVDTKPGVILAVAEAGLAVNLYRVSEELSRPLTDTEMCQFKVLMCRLFWEMTKRCKLDHFRDWHIEQQITVVRHLSVGCSDHPISIVRVFCPSMAIPIADHLFAAVFNSVAPFLVLIPCETFSNRGGCLSNLFLRKDDFLSEVSVAITRLRRVFSTPHHVNTWPYGWSSRQRSSFTVWNSQSSCLPFYYNVNDVWYHNCLDTTYLHLPWLTTTGRTIAIVSEDTWRPSKNRMRRS
jgi:hypothetical protein